jgi:putative tryptophan/tyrosine transport system substrate-binding protein
LGLDVPGHLQQIADEVIEMERREFITLLGAATAAWPLAVRSQPLPVRPLIGVLSPVSLADARPLIGAFRSALRDFGHVEGRNVTIAVRYGEGAPERMGPLAGELVALNPDVLVVGAQPGISALLSATQTIPIVALTLQDPVKTGLAQSIARPGGNITGMWTLGGDALVGKGLDFLKLAVPGLTRVGAPLNPDDPTDVAQISQLPAAARALGVTIELIEVRDLSNLDALAEEVMRANVQGLFVGQTPFYLSHRADIAALAARLSLPAVYGWRQFAEAGGLMSYGPNLPDMYRQLARLVDRILKGAKPADLSIELPTRYELIVNLKTAKATGLTISDSFVLLADEVIE